ncbi:MAG: hypothetical protein KBT48_11010 [Firmicutes bacterium]|nr:hypothetical protein [Bacillota bacterium]
MSQLADIYAQLDNVIIRLTDMNQLDQLEEEFRVEYFNLRDEMIMELSNLLMSQFNYDDNISLESKNEIIDLLNSYYEIMEVLKDNPIDKLFSVQGRIENMLVNKYMKLQGYRKNSESYWIE